MISSSEIEPLSGTSICLGRLLPPEASLVAGFERGWKTGVQGLARPHSSGQAMTTWLEVQGTIDSLFTHILRLLYPDPNPDPNPDPHLPTSTLTHVATPTNLLGLACLLDRILHG